MTSAELLVDAYSRIRHIVHQAVDELPPDSLMARVDPDANSIAWLVWHLTRVQDDHLADVMGTEQVWTKGGWADRFGLPFEPAATGYGHGTKEVAAVKVSSGDLLTGYFDAVHEETNRFLSGVTDSDLDRIVDKRWDPPVTLGVRLVSVISDNIQHAGQAAFVRGILLRVQT
jgi:uncharacterized damage-inducible protein DinB